jgi:glycosyltransferase involved in cell wall biosynthesis
MKVLFLGGVFDETMEKEILEKSKGIVQYAANRLQWNLIDGLLQIENCELEILSAPLIGSFPKDYVNIRIKGSKTFYKEKIKSIYVGFSNIWGYRNISRKNNLIKEIKSFTLDKSNNKSIIVYSPHTPYLQAAVYAKKKDPSIHICLIVPDLPQFMNLNDKKSLIYSMLKEIDIKIFNRLSKHINSFVLLTEYMRDMLKVRNRPYIVIEGVVNISDTFTNKKDINENVKTIVYTGTLNEKFGVVNLIKAIHELDNPDIVLKVCGRGDSEELISEYAKKDNRIHFLKQLSNEEAVNLQRNATVLINPRQDNEEFTKYSFPSKNMEYLMSGNPVIAYKLKGIPGEYDDYIFYVKDNEIESLKDKINEVVNLTSQERYEFGKKAKEFVIKNKNNKEASLKIFNMIKSSKE